MTANNFDLDEIRVASPCSVAWESMSGDERRRHCELCGLNVYNISGMTRGQAEELIANRAGRLCVRFYRRADGTVITKDCPVGLSAARKRVARIAGATLAAIVGLFSVSYGQKEEEKFVDASNLTIKHIPNSPQGTEITGTLIDPNGAFIPGAKLVLANGNSEKVKGTSNTDGRYSFPGLAAGSYSLLVSLDGFETIRIRNISIGSNERLELNLEMKLDGETVTVGIYADESMIDTTSSSVTTTITQRMIQRLPH